MRNKKINKLISFLLVFVMVLSMVPVNALAEDTTNQKFFNSNVGDEDGLDQLLIYTGTSTAKIESTALLGDANTDYPSRIVFDQKDTSYSLEGADSLININIYFAVIPKEENSTVMVNYGDALASNKSLSTLTTGSAITHKSTNFVRCITKPGKNVFNIVVTPPSGSSNTAVTYTFTMYCEPSLSGLSLNTSDSTLYLDKIFEASTMEYSTTIAEDTTTVNVVAIPKDSSYSITYNSNTSSAVAVSNKTSIEVLVSVGEGDEARSTTYKVNLTKVTAYDAKIIPTPSDSNVVVYDSKGVRIAKNAEGSYTGLLPGNNYTYVVTKYGYVAQTGKLTSAADLTHGTLNVTLSEASAPAIALPNYSGEWTNFRGNDENMGITNAETPISKEESNLKWAKKYGTGYAAAPTPPVIVNNVLYIAVSKNVLILNKETGEELKRSPDMAGAVGYALNPITYAEGMIFVPVGNGQIQAMRADTLELLWVSEKLSGQTLTPITYHNGYIYTGTWNSEVKTGTYFCLSVTDEDLTSSNETKLCTWKLDHTGGFYWAGSYATDEYVIFGSDDGSSEGDYVQTAVLYSVNPKTGEVIDTIKGIKGDIRSTVSYDKTTDRIYFSTKGGWFYTVKVNADGTFDDSTEKCLDTGGMSTGTPLVYNGRAYLGVSGASQFSKTGHSYKVIDVNTMTEIYSVDIPGYVQTSALLSTAYVEKTGKVYIYVTYNYTPGGIYVIEDSAGQTEAKGYDLFVPTGSLANYCICSLVCDKDGTIYYKNDSCNLMAVERNSASATDITVTGGNASLSPTFDMGILTYEVTVDCGTASIIVTPSVNSGSSVTVNGTDNSKEIALTDGIATATVIVTNETSTRTYMLNIREKSKDATLSVLYGSSSNTANASLLSMVPAFDENTLNYTVYGVASSKSFVNLWTLSKDSNATVEVKVVSGISDMVAGDVVSITATNSNTNRYALYYATSPVFDTVIVDIKVTAEDGVTTKTYRVNLTKQSLDTFTLKDITEFAIGENVGTIDAINNTIAVSVPYGTSITSLTPTITVSSGAIINPISGAPQDFTSPVIYTVTGQDGSTKTYTVTVTVSENTTPGGEVTPVVVTDKIKTSLTDGATQKGSKLTFDVWATNKKGNKIDSEVTLNGKIIDCTWDDDSKTSFTLTFSKEGNNTVVVTAGTATETYTINYKPAKDGDVIGEAVVSVEAFTIGGGYLVDPVSVDIIEGENTAQLLNGLLKENGYTYDSTGKLTNNFYLAVLYGGVLPIEANVPEVLKTALKKNGFTLDETDDTYDGGLGEFNYTNGSGWMYCVNTIFPNVSFSDYYLTDGDVMRVQYTLAYGSDIGGSSAAGYDYAKDYYNVADKDNLTRMIADYGIDNVPKEVLAIATKVNATKSEVSAAIKALKESKTTPNETGGTAGTSNVTVVNKTGDISAYFTTKEVDGEEVKATFTKNDDGSIKINLTAGEKNIGLLEGGILVKIKTDKIGSSSVAVLVNGDGSETIIKKSVAANGVMIVPLSGTSTIKIIDNAKTFIDTDNHWAKDSISFVAAHELLLGTADGNFSPDAKMTRSMLVTAIYRLENATAANDAKDFSDVESGLWYTDAVSWATENDIVGGYGNGNFGTDDSITREQISIILFRYAKFCGLDVSVKGDTSKFSDADKISEWSTDAIGWAIGCGLISGRSEETLSPDGIATRAEIATILQRFIENIAK